MSTWPLRILTTALAVALTAALQLAGTSASATTPAPAPAGGDPVCREYTVPVSALPVVASEERISGELCLPASGAAKTVHVAVPGATYNRSYWDFPMAEHSYAKQLAKKGHAVFALDRLNTGKSSSIPPELLTIDVDAATVHQVIGALRAGKVGGTKFDKVIIVGHSLGSTITVQEAGLYRDVDGVILTGFSHWVNPSFAADLAMLRVVAPIAPDDPSRSPHVEKQPFGEWTTPPGAREKYFYSPATTNRAVLAADERSKDIITVGELGTFAEAVVGPVSNLIDVPVLFASAENDVIFHCGLQNCKTKSAIRTWEGPRFLASPSFEPFVLKGAGHDLNLATNAMDFFGAAADWSDRHFGRAAG